MSKEWIKHVGNYCPIPTGTLIDVQYRDGKVAEKVIANINDDNHRIRDAGVCFWEQEGEEEDIVAYRLSEETEKISEDYVIPEGWNKHDGKGMPVVGDVIVRVWLYGEDEADVEDSDHVSRASNWGWNWYSSQAGCADILYWKLGEEVEKSSPVKSDGGSSNYYKITIKNELGEEFHCETNDVLYALVGGDFDMSNIIKACRRMYEASQGRGKQGTDIAYDVKKIKYFATDFERRFGNA